MMNFKNKIKNSFNSLIIYFDSVIGEINYNTTDISIHGLYKRPATRGITRSKLSGSLFTEEDSKHIATRNCYWPRCVHSGRVIGDDNTRSTRRTARRRVGV